jgi:hypothetical protein
MNRRNSIGLTAYEAEHSEVAKECSGGFGDGGANKWLSVRFA